MLSCKTFVSLSLKYLALAAAVSASSPTPSEAQAGAAGKPETTKNPATPVVEVRGAKLGFIALTDMAPLAVAKEKGLFSKHGVPDVDVIKQASWGATRDNIELGSGKGGIDGAHILNPMPLAFTQGVMTKGSKPVPMYVLLALNYNNQAISYAAKYGDLKLGVDASPLKEYAEAAKKKKQPLAFAMTFPTGTHNMWIRYWLAAGGIDPDADVATIVVPPPQMVANMRVGNMEAFCVCEPWGQQLINQRIGYTACMTQEIWNNHPEKVLGMRKDWVDAHPNAAKAIVKAVIEAQIWCDNPANHDELARILSQKNWINAPYDDLVTRIRGNIDYGDGKPKKTGMFMLYYKHNASFPYKSHGKWFLAEMRRWGFFPQGVEYDKVVDAVYRPDIWRECAKELGRPEAEIPTADSRGVEKFFDGVTFDPADPEAYLAKLKIKNVDGKKGMGSKK